MSHLIFVYGTLKHDFHNHHVIRGQKYLGHASTDASWQMYSLGGFPGVVKGENIIMGELWEVDDNHFASCDMLEGHPSFYKREIVRVTDNDGTKHYPWMYIYQGSTDKLKPVGGW